MDKLPDWARAALSQAEIAWLAFLVFAIYGGASRTLADNRTVGKSGLPLVSEIVINSFISGFCGMMVISLYKMLHLNVFAALFLAGIAGYMGVGFLELMVQAATNAIKRRISPNGSSSASTNTIQPTPDTD